MKPRKKEIDYITPQTKYSKSLLISLGYKLELVRKGDTSNDDTFMVFLDGAHVPYKKRRVNVPYVTRANFYSFASGRHNSLRLAPIERKIEYCID